MNSLDITLGGVTYTLPKLNLGELRAISRALNDSPGDAKFDIVAIALARAVPAPLANVMSIASDIPEFVAAADAIMKFTGFVKQDDAANPPAPAAETLTP